MQNPKTHKERNTQTHTSESISLGSITSGASFRTAVKNALMVLFMMLLGGWLLTMAVTNTLRANLQAQLEEESILLQDIYQSQGQEGVLSAMSELTSQAMSSERVAGLFDANHLRLAGNMQVYPDLLNLNHVSSNLAPNDDKHVIVKQVQTTLDEKPYLIRVRQFGNMQLVVGRSTNMLHAVQHQLIFWFSVISIGVLFAMLFVGFGSSRQSFKKLTRLEQTLKQVADGDLSARFKITKPYDQIDRVALGVNANLARMQHLIQSIQSASTAIAHDLKTPLSRLHISLNDALDSLNEDKATCVHNQTQTESLVQHALDEVTELNVVFDTMLRISRIKTTQAQHFTPFAMHDCINKVVDFLAPLAQENSQHIQVRCPEDIVLTADQDMVQQALMNLINNAIVHAGSGTTISISAFHEHATTVLEVSDNGVGVPEDSLSKLTDLFARADNSRTTTGNGLGLALVDAVAKHHDAQLILSTRQLNHQPNALANSKNSAKGFCARLVFPVSH